MQALAAGQYWGRAEGGGQDEWGCGQTGADRTVPRLRETSLSLTRPGTEQRHLVVSRVKVCGVGVQGLNGQRRPAQER